MRISDWSSDVCSSDLLAARQHQVVDQRTVATNSKGGKRQHQERTYRKGGKPRLAHQKAVVDEAGEVDDDQDREGNVPEVSGQSHRRRGLALFAGEGPADKVTERRAHPQDRGQSYGSGESRHDNSEKGPALPEIGRAQWRDRARHYVAVQVYDDK